MIITFLGHSSLYNCENLLEEIKRTIMKNINGEDNVCFYCGGYGDFDNLCAEACRLVKNEQENSEIVFVTPYITELQQEKMKYLVDSKLYDSIIYPPLECVPLKFAISKRNEWMVDRADLIIAYVKHTYGGAYKSFLYAKRRKKHIINLA